MANQQADAKVTALTGKAYAERNGTRITLTEGADIYASDTIITDSSSGVEVVFRDNAVIKLGPGSQVAVQDFVYDGENNPSFAVQLVTGVMTSLSGEVVKQNPAAFKISTPRATIGIRGTETYHSVAGDAEVHAVVHISKGHIVMLNSSDGQAITLGSAMQAVTLNESGKPLTIRTFQPNEMDKLQDALGSVNKKPQGEDAPLTQEAQDNVPNSGDEGAQNSAPAQAAVSSTVVQDEIRVVVVAEAGTESTVAVVQDAMQAAQDTTGILIESPVISPIGGTATESPSSTLPETLLADNPITAPDEFAPPQSNEPTVTPPPPPGETWQPHNKPVLNNETFNTGDGNDSITVGTMTNSVINAGGGNDIINIGTMSGASSVYGGEGNDTITINVLNTIQTPPSAAALISGGNSSTGAVDGGDDHIIIKHIAGGGGIASVQGGGGNDTFSLGTWDNNTVLRLDMSNAAGNKDKLEFLNGAYEAQGNSGGPGSNTWVVEFTPQPGSGNTLTIVFEGITDRADYDAMKNNGQISGLL